MPNVIVDITVSLDGFVTGEHADEQQELGDPPEPTRDHAAGCGIARPHGHSWRTIAKGDRPFPTKPCTDDRSGGDARDDANC